MNITTERTPFLVAKAQNFSDFSGTNLVLLPISGQLRDALIEWIEVVMSLQNVTGFNGIHFTGVTADFLYVNTDKEPELEELIETDDDDYPQHYLDCTPDELPKFVEAYKNVRTDGTHVVFNYPDRFVIGAFGKHDGSLLFESSPILVSSIL